VFYGASTVSVVVVERVRIVWFCVSKCNFVCQKFLIDWGGERHSSNTFHTSLNHSLYTIYYLRLNDISRCRTYSGAYSQGAYSGACGGI